jgi:hypothetical protein
MGNLTNDEDSMRQLLQNRGPGAADRSVSRNVGALEQRRLRFKETSAQIS